MCFKSTVQRHSSFLYGSAESVFGLSLKYSVICMVFQNKNRTIIMGKGLIIFFFLLALKPAFAQTDSISAPSQKPEKVHHPVSYYFRDSASLARYLAKKDSIQHVKDSLKILGDSLSMAWIKRPDPSRPDRFLDSLLEVYTVKNLDFKGWAKQFPADLVKNAVAVERLKD